MIDAHVHIGQLHKEYSVEFAGQLMKACDRITEDITVTCENLIREMDLAQIDKVVLLAFDAKRTLGVHVSNELVAEYCKRHTNRFIGLASYDAKMGLNRRELHRSLAKYELSGYKLACGYLNLSPADHDWNPLYEDAQERELPVLIHMGYSPVKQVALRYCMPDLLEDVLIRYPRLTIIIAHLAWPWVTETLNILRKYEHAYADLSIVSYFQPVKYVAEILGKAESTGVSNKLLWGTDYPMCTFAQSLNRLKEVKLAMTDMDIHVISEPNWQGILHDHARKLFKLV